MDTHTPSAEMATAIGLDPIPPRPERLESVDLVRGLVMILMALDSLVLFSSAAALRLGGNPRRSRGGSCRL